MALMSDYLENKLANHVFGTKNMESPKSIWVGLFYSNPTDSHIRSEIIGKGYIREQIEFDSPKNGLMKNSKEIIFHKATSLWPTVTHISLFDADFGGNQLFHGEVSTPISIKKNKNFVISIGDLQVGFE